MANFKTQIEIKAVDNASSSVKKVNSQMKNMGKTTKAIGKNTKQSTKNISKFSKATKTASRNAKKMKSSFSGMTKTLKTAAKAGVLLAGAIGAKAVTSALSYQRELQKLAFQFDLTSSASAKAKFDKMFDEVGKKTGVARNELAKMTRTLNQAGFSIDDMEKGLTTLGNLGKVSNANAEELIPIYRKLKREMPGKKELFYQTQIKKIIKAQGMDAQKAISITAEYGDQFKALGFKMNDVFALANSATEVGFKSPKTAIRKVRDFTLFMRKEYKNMIPKKDIEEFEKLMKTDMTKALKYFADGLQDTDMKRLANENKIAFEGATLLAGEYGDVIENNTKLIKVQTKDLELQARQNKNNMKDEINQWEILKTKAKATLTDIGLATFKYGGILKAMMGDNINYIRTQFVDALKMIPRAIKGFFFRTWRDIKASIFGVYIHLKTQTMNALLGAKLMFFDFANFVKIETYGRLKRYFTKMKVWGVKKFSEMKEKLFSIFIEIEKKIKAMMEKITGIPEKVKSGVGSFVQETTGLDLGIGGTGGDVSNVFDMDKLKAITNQKGKGNVEQTNNNKIIINVTNASGEQGASETSNVVVRALKLQSDANRALIGA